VIAATKRTPHPDTVPEDAVALRLRLQRARWRLRTAAPGSPEWDAATEALEELERRLVKLKPAAR